MKSSLTKRTRVPPVTVGIWAESPARLTVTRYITSIASWLAVWDRSHPIKQVRKEVSFCWNGHRWSGGNRHKHHSDSEMCDYLLNWPYASLIASVFILCALLQLASVGTFQVLKLPLGFIRVLEWVSCNFDCALHAVTSLCSVNTYCLINCMQGVTRVCMRWLLFPLQLVFRLDSFLLQLKLHHISAFSAYGVFAFFSVTK